MSTIAARSWLLTADMTSCSAADCILGFPLNWPFGAPYPAFFYDPRTALRSEHAILHAKCAVVDGRYALVTSANFTNSGQTRNVEVGVLMDDEAFARRLEGQFNVLVGQGSLVECPFRASPER